MELVVGVVHLIHPECGFQAALVERLVVCHQGQAFDERLNPLPHFGENRSVLRISGTKAVYLTTPVVGVLRFGLDEGLELIHYLPTAHDHHANRANRRALVVGSLKIYRCEIAV